MKQIVSFLIIFGYSYLPAEELNIAKAPEYPYADVAAGREAYKYANKKANEVRLYDFYQRQADYYMDKKHPTPRVLPSYPGLDGGLHGHWGKYNQNGYRDSRWNAMGQRQFLGQNIENISDSITVKVSDRESLFAVFSAKANLSFFKFWHGSYPEFFPYRWETSHGVKVKSPQTFNCSLSKVRQALDQKDVSTALVGWQVKKKDQEYLGFYDTDEAVIFSYKIKSNHILDSVEGLPNNVYQRTIEFQDGFQGADVVLFDIQPGTVKIDGDTATGTLADGSKNWLLKYRVAGPAKIQEKNGSILLSLGKQAANESCKIWMSTSKNAIDSRFVDALKIDPYATKKLSQLLGQYRPRWQKEVRALERELAENERAYVVDNFEVPFQNKNNSLMFLTGIDFDRVGNAFVCTLMGEVYRVSNLAEDGKKVVWKKIATGLNQPFGLRIWDRVIHVLEREQITQLIDLNDDGEIDFYKNFSNAFRGLAGSHAHTFGLERDSSGSTYLVAEWNAYKIAPDGKSAQLVTRGLRNCMGFGKMSDGTILVGPQEGTNTPTSTIIELEKGANHGFKNRDPLSVPLGYVPRGIDNSTGGFLEVDSERWRPLGRKGLIGICYGYGSWYQILFDQNFAAQRGEGKAENAVLQRQIASVPIAGEFTSGVVLGAVNPKDGQVYLVGLDGWGDYALKDGCLHRLRYTGEPYLNPIGYQTFDNGIAVHFDRELDSSCAENPAHYFAQMWNYNNSSQYGLPEYSVNYPDSLGHDPLKVTSSHLLDSKKSIFVGIPEIQPVMQMHLRMHLKTKDGLDFKTDLFPSIMNLGPYKDFPGSMPKEKKNRNFVLRHDRTSSDKESLVTQSGPEDAHAKKILIQSVTGLKFDTLNFKVKAGESIALQLDNKDAMPHNLVIVRPGKQREIGEAAFKMLNDPKALEKSYVPDDKSNVIAYTSVVPSGGSHTTYFKAPEHKGSYPFICTFPGHWQIMQGTMTVE